MKPAIPVLSIAALTLSLAAEPSIIPAGYRVETIATPLQADGTEVQFGVGGIDFSADGTAYVAGRVSGVWTYRNGKWKQFAHGLHDPQGIDVSPDGRTVVVSQKPELTEIRDTDGDGIGDVYRTLCDKWGFAGNYCEYVHGIAKDSQGNRFLAINLADGGSGDNTPGLTRAPLGNLMASTGGYDGWAVKITPSGDMIPYASGLRSPAGIGIGPNDEVFYTDNQGGWVGNSMLHLVEKGDFFGYPASLLDHPDFGTPESITLEKMWAMRKLPVAWIPHGELANSPGNPEFDLTQGKFGPFAGQIFIGDQTRSNVFRVALDKVDGEYQGCVFNFVDHLQSGCIRIRFDQLGRLWVGQTGRGWRSRGSKQYGLERISWDGKTTPFEMHHVKATPKGFRITFTKPVDPDTIQAAMVTVSHWHFQYHAKYGSPKVGVTKDAVRIASLSDGGRTVELQLSLKAGELYHIKLGDVRSAAGERMSNHSAYYTLNKIPK